MNKVMEEEFKRWTAQRKAALALEIMLEKTTVAEAKLTGRLWLPTVLIGSYEVNVRHCH